MDDPFPDDIEVVYPGYAMRFDETQTVHTVCVGSLYEVPKHLDHLRIVSGFDSSLFIPDHIKYVEIIHCEWLQLITLGENTTSIRIVKCPRLWRVDIKSAKNLEDLDISDAASLDIIRGYFPPSMKKLRIQNSGIRKLPPFPDGIEKISLTGVHIDDMPEIPPSVTTLWPGEGEFWLRSHEFEDHTNGIYADLIRNQQEQLSQARQRSRLDVFHEELVQKVFHPRKVAMWLELGGFELLEMMFDW